VDYSVHIGHAYLVAPGSRHTKALAALSTIGPAVFNGGLTTFLALSLCSLSTGHVFLTFFKVFSLTVAFGLYHGLVLFPVLLSYLGPVSKSEPEPGPAPPPLQQGKLNTAFQIETQAGEVNRQESVKGV